MAVSYQRIDKIGGIGGIVRLAVSRQFCFYAFCTDGPFVPFVPLSVGALRKMEEAKIRAAKERETERLKEMLRMLAAVLESRKLHCWILEKVELQGSQQSLAKSLAKEQKEQKEQKVQQKQQKEQTKVAAADAEAMRDVRRAAFET